MKMVHGLKTLLLKLSLVIVFFFSVGVQAKTLKVDTVTASVADGDFAIVNNGTGDIKIGVGSGFAKLTSGILSNQAFIDVVTEISGVVPIANGGTNSNAALTSGFVMESLGGAIVESSTTAAELTYLDATSSIQTQIDANESELTNSAGLIAALSDETGTGLAVFNTSPTLITPSLGTPTSGVMTNITGTASGFTAGNVTTNANLTGGVTSAGNAATVVTNANLTGHITSTGNAAILGSFTTAQLLAAVTGESGTGAAIFGTSPTIGTPAINSANANFGTASNTVKLLLPNSTTSGLDALTDTAALFAYDTDLGAAVVNNGTGWSAVGGGGGGGSKLNLIDASSFESDITEGTCVNCSLASETTNVLATTLNVTSLKITATAASATYIVDKTTSSQWDTGLGILKTAWIKTAATDVTIISRVGGADEAVTLNVNGDGNWHVYKLPTLSNATSNGYKINIPTDTSIVYVDETEIKPNDEIFIVGQAHFVGKVDLSNDCTYTRKYTTYGVMLDSNTCSATSITGNLSLSTNSLQSGIKISNFRTDGHYRVELQGLIYGNTSNVCQYTLSKSALYEGNGTIYLNANSPTLSEGQIDANVKFDTSDTGEVFLLNKGATTAASCALFGTASNPSSWSVHFYPDASSTIVAQETELTASTVNELSAVVTITGLVLAENYEWIDNCSKSGSVYTCTYKTGIFTEFPICTYTPNGATSNSGRITSISSTAIGIYTVADSQFHLQCSKQGADVNKSATIVGSFEAIKSTELDQVEDSPSSTVTSGVDMVLFPSPTHETNNFSPTTTSVVPSADGFFIISGFYRYDSGASGSLYLYENGVLIKGLYINGGTAESVIPINAIAHLTKGKSYTMRWNQTFVAQATGMSISALPDTASIVKNMNDNNTTLCETKTLSADISATGTMTDLTFSNLEVGKKYSISGHFYPQPDGVTGNKYVFVNMLGAGFPATEPYYIQNSFSNMHAPLSIPRKIWVSDGTNVTFTISAINRYVLPLSKIWVQLCELPDSVQFTTKF